MTYMLRVRWLAMLFVVAIVSMPSFVRAASTAAGQSTLQTDFASAAREFHVPLSILLSVSYNESLWEQHNGQPSTWGGYGVMHLTNVPLAALVVNGNGDEASVRAKEADAALHTLLTAARLLNEKPSLLRFDVAQNIRGGAALLAQYARGTTGTIPSRIADWYGAVAEYSASHNVTVARSFADAVFQTIRQGATRVTSGGQRVTLARQAVRSNAGTLARLHLQGRDTQQTNQTAECPQGLRCQFVPAAYTQNNPSDPYDYGNYDVANRPADGLDIRYVVIHDTEYGYQPTIQLFQNPTAYVSAHYVVRSSDGQVTQMVPTKDVAWHAGNWYVNTHAVGIENEGYAVTGASWYTEQEYRSTALLTRYLASRFGIPLDRMHIVGHDNVPGPTPAYTAGMHWDPGPYWNWSHFMAVMGAPIVPTANGNTSSVVEIAPTWEVNQPTVTYCDTNPCRTLPAQPANFVYLYSAPSTSSSLISDDGLVGTNLEPNGAGTTQANDWGDKAVAGQQFYRFAQQGDWTGIDYGGKAAWFYNPNSRNAVGSTGLLITPKPGAASIPVYGRAYPEASAYPSTVPVQSVVPLQYTIPAGQEYVASGPVRSDYYYAPTYTLNPADHTVVIGTTMYYEIQLNHRFAYVKASDVVPAE